jgi:hypothetical protein
MTFSRAKPTNWLQLEVLTANQMNIIDRNQSNALDGKDGGEWNTINPIKINHQIEGNAAGKSTSGLKGTGAPGVEGIGSDGGHGGEFTGSLNGSAIVATASGTSAAVDATSSGAGAAIDATATGTGASAIKATRAYEDGVPAIDAHGGAYAVKAVAENGNGNAKGMYVKGNDDYASVALEVVGGAITHAVSPGGKGIDCWGGANHGSGDGGPAIDAKGGSPNGNAIEAAGNGEGSGLVATAGDSSGAIAIVATAGSTDSVAISAYSDSEVALEVQSQSTEHGALRIVPRVSDPTNPNNGDMWTTDGGKLRIKLNGTVFDVDLTPV